MISVLAMATELTNEITTELISEDSCEIVDYFVLYSFKFKLLLCVFVCAVSIIFLCKKLDKLRKDNKQDPVFDCILRKPKNKKYPKEEKQQKRNRKERKREKVEQNRNRYAQRMESVKKVYGYGQESVGELDECLLRDKDILFKRLIYLNNRINLFDIAKTISEGFLLSAMVSIVVADPCLPQIIILILVVFAMFMVLVGYIILDTAFNNMYCNKEKFILEYEKEFLIEKIKNSYQKANQTVTTSMDSYSFSCGESTKIIANSTGDGPLSYSSNNTSVATVNSSGVVTAKGFGKATITVIASGTDNYNPSKTVVGVTVTPILSTMFISTSFITLVIGDKYVPNVSREKTSFDCSLSNVNVVTVDDYGVITAKAVGKAIVRVEVKEVNEYDKPIEIIYVTVKPT